MMQKEGAHSTACTIAKKLLNLISHLQHHIKLRDQHLELHQKEAETARR